MSTEATLRDDLPMDLPPDNPENLTGQGTLEVPVAEPQEATIGHYRIIEKIGAGGMGEVYLAHDPSLRRTVAIKSLRTDLTADKIQLKRFEREAYSASSLNHPNILTIFEFGHQGNCHYIVTEFVDGQSLTRRITQEPLAVEQILDIAIQVASALEAAHEAGIVHRDIKPDNIMLRRDNLVKVLDFGIAKLTQVDGGGADSEDLSRLSYATHPGIVMGTPRYMSPEQARGTPLDGRTDIWSLGVVIYNMVTRKMPFVGAATSDVLIAVISKEPPPLSKFAPNVPAELERIVMKALNKDREARYQNARVLGQDLKALRHKLEFEAELERSGAHTASGTGIIGQIKQRKAAALSIGVILLSVLIAVGYFTLGGSQEGITSLAVLPFINASNDPEKDYLSEGISESLVSRLSQIPGLKVIASSSTVRYKDQHVDPQDVARELNITGVLMGRVSQRGDSLSITVELIDGRDRTQVWGDQYNRKSEDLVAIQSEISRVITEKLRLKLTEGEQEQTAKSETVNPEAYELLLKGRSFRSRGGADERKKAADYFKQAIAIDPAYAPAYADLSDIYRSLIGSSILDPKEYLPKAEAAAHKALELDESLADAHYALANLKTYSWQWTEAEQEYKRAVELNPNLALARRWYASYLRLMGQHDQAIAEIQRARELDPLSPGVNATVGYVLFSARRYDESIEDLKKTLGLDGEYPYTYLFLGFNYSATGIYDKAIFSYEQAIELGLDTPSTQINLGAAYAGAGNVDRARMILNRLRASKQYVSPGELAILYTALGDTEQAFASLEQAYKAHDLQLQYLGVSPGFDPLRADPRFQDLLRRVGLTG